MNEAQERTAAWREFVRLFAVLFSLTFSASLVGYWFLSSVCRQQCVFGALFRMFLYHYEHPAQYLGLVAFIYALLAAAWGIRARTTGWRMHAGLVVVIVATLLLSSAVGGVLWTFHDMQAGYFPPWDRRIGIFTEGALTGVQIGWLIVLLSFPLNLFCTIFAYGVTYYLVRRTLPVA